MTPEAFLAVADLLGDATLLVSREGTIVAANRASAEVVGRAPAEIRGRALGDLVLEPERLAQFLGLCSRSREPLPGSLTFRRDGEPLECRCDGALAVPAGEAAPALVFLSVRPKARLATRFRLLNETIDSLHREIRERQRVELALRASEELTRRILESSLDCIQLLDLDGRLLSSNALGCAGLGQGRDPAAGEVWTESWAPDGRPEAEEALAQARAGRPGRFYAASAGAGGSRWWDVQVTPLLDLQGRPERLVSIARDITERRMAEEQGRQAAKMEALGRVAGGLAHDFNNNLHVLLGLSESLARNPGLGEEGQGDVAEMRQVTGHMAALTRQLLAFSRRQVLQVQPVELNRAAAESQALLRRLLAAQVEFATELAAEPLWIETDRSQLLQAIMNLAINARDAMPGGGRLLLRTRRYEAGEDAAVPTGRYAELAMSDTGGGIPPEHLPHIFDPFYTTKPLGAGTGLGLATVHGIVSQSRGYVRAESEIGRGTTFTLLFPLISPP